MKKLGQQFWGRHVHCVIVGRVVQYRFNRTERRWHTRGAGTVAKDKTIWQLLKQVTGIEAFSQSEEGKQQASEGVSMIQIHMSADWALSHRGPT